MNEANATTQRAEAENKRMLKQLSSARETIDAQKNETERLQSSLEDLKSKHETDIAQMRKTTASLQRERSDLQNSLDALKSDVAKKSRTLPNRFGSPATPTDATGTPGDDDDDVFTGGNSMRRKYDSSTLRSAADGMEDDSWLDTSPSKPSTVTTPSHLSTEVEDLKQSLAHAHRQMSALKNSVQREKEQKMEYRRKLALRGEAPDEWEDDEDANAGSASTRAVGSSRGRALSGRGRGTGRLTLAQKLGIVAAERAMSNRSQGDGAELELELEETDDGDAPSPFIEPKSNRPVSVDGMDPAFANVLHSLSSKESIKAADDSPEQPRFATFPRRARGGGAFKSEPRPPSTGDIAPTALSAELGGPSTLEEDPAIRSENLYGIYVPESCEFGVQVDAPPVQTLVRADAGVQTETQEPAVSNMVETKPMTTDVGVQHENSVVTLVSVAAQTHIPPRPILVHVSASTEPEPQRTSLGVSTDPQSTSDSSVQTVLPSTSDTSTQTILPRTIDAEIQTITPDAKAQLPDTKVHPPDAGIPPISVPIIVEPSNDVAPSSLSSSSRHVIPRPTSLGRSQLRPVAMIFESDSEETETEGEYVDARETEPTPFSSVQDFQSFQSAIEHTDGDADSVQTSTELATLSDAFGERSVRSRHDSQATTRVTVHARKPEVKEVSVQTEEWIPAPRQAPPAAISFHRIGSTQTTQFQYVPSSPLKATSSSLALAASIVRSPVRDSIGTFGNSGRVRTSSITSASEGVPQTDAVMKDETSSVSPIPHIDRSRPPTMSLPPPPSMPPPPSIPTRKSSVPPPRPTSPPPAELIQRATTPTFGRQSALMVPPNRANRPVNNNMPPSQGLRHPPSIGSFRSATNAAASAGPPTSAFISPRKDRREMSQTSLLSASSAPSRRISISSSHSSAKKPITNVAPSPETPSNPVASSTDPAVIHAITQTMIGEFLYKYTRRVVGKGHGEKRHKRFFWVHPYTRTLYWSSADPGAAGTGESNAKSGEYSPQFIQSW